MFAGILAPCGGCVVHPSVTIKNASAVAMNGYVQIPSIVTYLGVGYPSVPQASSREVLHLDSGEERRYSYRREHTVEEYGSAIYVAILRSDGRWYLAMVDGREDHSPRLSVTVDAEGYPQIASAGEKPDVNERVVTKKELMAAMGERSAQ